jgi:hypothetical protein
VERGILTAYWLVSGYSLRAWRALAWLAILTAAFAAAVHVIGFTNPQLVTWLLRGVLGCQGTNTTTTTTTPTGRKTDHQLAWHRR